MKLSTSKDANVNYLARIIKLEDSNFSPHPNADKLKLVHLHGNTISIGIDTTSGYYVYFPVECVIAPEFLKFHNLYREPTLNANPEEKGFFEESGRVKCIKLRGIASEGFIMPYAALYRFAINPSTNPTNLLAIYEEAQSLVDTTFDTVEETKLVWKYVIKVKTAGVNLNGKVKKARMIDRIIEDQFRFHIDTLKLQDNIYNINPKDLIQISIKCHGCVDADTIITTNNGPKTIKEIVDNRLNVNVLAYDVETHQKCFVPIDDYYKLEDDGDWVEIELENGSTIVITTNNPVWLPLQNCYRKVENLSVGDVLLFEK